MAALGPDRSPGLVAPRTERGLQVPTRSFRDVACDPGGASAPGMTAPHIEGLQVHDDLRPQMKRKEGERPSRWAPTVSKCVMLACTCWVTVLMSRKRRSNGLASK